MAVSFDDLVPKDPNDFSDLIPQQPQGGGVMGTLKGVSRALENNLPFMDRAVAAAKGGDYDTNLATERATNEQFAKDNPWTNTAGAGAVGAAASGAAALGPAALGAAGLAGRVSSGILGGFGVGGLYGASNSPDLTNIPKTAESTLQGANTMAALGGAAPLVASGIGKALSPLSVPAARQPFIDALKAGGVAPTAGQMLGSKFIQGLEGPSEGGFTKAIMGAGGIPASDATQPSIAAAKKAIGDQFDALASRNTLVPDEQLSKDLSGAPGAFNKLISPSPEVANVADRLATRTSQPIDGPEYASMRSELTNKAYAISKTNPVDAQAYRGMRDALDDAMERSVAANNPDDAAAFKEVRRQYGNFQDISKAASKLTGENAVAGTIPPSRMQAVLSAGNKAPGYAAGQGDLAELTRAGAGILQPQGTTVNPLARALLSHSLGGYAGAALGHLPGIGALARSRPVQAYLSGQAAPGIGRAANISGLAAVLAARPQLTQQQGTGP